MELGKRIRAARLEAGLSQRQVCGTEITRNMLSLIENGTARPSMTTLLYLAEQLGKPISFFLEEQTVTSPNRQRMEDARAHWKAGDSAAVVRTLEDYTTPDETFDQERGLLMHLALTALASQAASENRLPYARELLSRAGSFQSIYLTADALRPYRLLQARLGDPDALPSDDEALLLRAELALEQGKLQRCLEFLAATEDKTTAHWAFLQGSALTGLHRFEEALPYLREAEEAYSRQVWPLAEQCCRELGDFRSAYEYACKQRQ